MRTKRIGIRFWMIGSMVNATVSGVTDTASRPCGITVWTWSGCVPGPKPARSTKALISSVLVSARMDLGARSLIFTLSASCVSRASEGGFSVTTGTEKVLSVGGFWSFITKIHSAKAATSMTIFVVRL